MMKFKAMLVTSLFFCAGSFAADTYHISSAVYKGLNLVAEPSMVVEAGNQASMTLGDDFSYDVTVTPQPENTVMVEAKLRAGDTSLTPQMLVKLGEEASMEVGDTKLNITVTAASL